MTDCKCKDSTGWTTVKCCNLCGKSVEEFWKVDDAKDKEIQSLTEQLQKANEIIDQLNTGHP
jgi:hypothetical protein